MNAPAKMVAVWRAEANEVNIGNPFFILIGPLIGPVPSLMQGACQIRKAVIFQ